MISEGIELFRRATEVEVELDVTARRISDTDAVSKAIEATDLYMAACSEFMKASSTLKNNEPLHVLLSRNIAFIMKRIEALQVLIYQQGACRAPHVVLSAEQVRVQREKARISQPTDSDEKKRTRVAQEIIDTETSYSAALQKLVDYYVTPFRDSKLVSNTSELFGNIEEILGLSVAFLKALETKMKNWNENQTIGDAFKQHAMFFKIYVFYTNGYQAGNAQAIHLLKTNDSVSASI